MNMQYEELYCPNSNKHFKTVKCSFSLFDDKDLIEKLKSEGMELSKKLNPVLARDSRRSRLQETIDTNAIAGVIAEYLWRLWLNKYASDLKVNVVFKKTDFTEITNQIDIQVIYKDEIKKSIEVRSSFPYTGIANAVCRVFDIIGWYANEVKTNEIKKDYYARCLFPYKVEDFAILLDAKFDAYLTGGATKDLLENSPNARYKEFVPYDEFIASSMSLTKYRVIEPIINGLDTAQLSNVIIKGEIGSVSS